MSASVYWEEGCAHNGDLYKGVSNSHKPTNLCHDSCVALFFIFRTLQLLPQNRGYNVSGACVLEPA